MATPTTLVEMAQQRRAAWVSEKSAAQAAAAETQADLTSAEQALADANAIYARLQTEAARIRMQLAAITTPADGEPLLDQLEQAIIALRAAQNTALTAEGSRARSRAALAAAQARTQEAQARLTQASADLDQATADRQRRQAATSAQSQPPLDTLPASATALLGSTSFSAAQSRVNGDFPAALRERARERAGFAQAHLTRTRQSHADILQLLSTELTGKGGPSGKIEPLAAAVTRAESALLDYVARAKERYDRAEAALLRIGAATNPPLTPEQIGRINDAALQTDRESAADAESERDHARDLAEQRQAAFDLERIKVLAAQGEAGLTAALADAASAVAQAKQQLDAANTALTQKQNDYTSAMRNLLDAWEAAVPDSAWRDLFELDDAQVQLTALQVNPSALVTALTNAEAALLAAHLTNDQDESLQRTYRAETARLAGQVQFESGAAARSTLGALRGDA
jgi:hypothetical protein